MGAEQDTLSAGAAQCGPRRPEPTWRRLAACRGYPVELFFPVVGQDPKEAKTICAGCPVREECLAEALAVPVAYDHGVWGGTSAKERQALRRRQRKEAA